jgi:hypothetical protein
MKRAGQDWYIPLIIPIRENAARSRDPQESGMKEEADICIRLGIYLRETITNVSRGLQEVTTNTSRGIT